MKNPNDGSRMAPARGAMAAVLAALALAALAGCSSGGSSTSTTSAASPAATLANASAPVGPLPTLGYRLEWRGFPQVGGRGIKHFDVAGDTVITHDWRNVLTVMEDATGANRWATKLGNDLTKFVGNARIGDQLLACSENEIQILDIRTGAIEERQRLTVLANTPPIIVGSIAVFGGTSGELFGHNLRSGYKQWGYSMSGRISSHPAHAEPDDVVVFSNSGEGAIVNALSGQAFGRRPMLFGDLVSNPIAGDGSVFAAGTDQSVWAFARETGNQLWRYRTQSRLTDQPTFHDGRVYQAIPGEGLVAINANSGAVLWTSKGVRGSVISARSGSPGRLLVWDGQDAILLDAARGDEIERVSMPDVRALRVAPFVDGNVYTATSRGIIEKYTPRN